MYTHAYIYFILLGGRSQFEHSELKLMKVILNMQI